MASGAILALCIVQVARQGCGAQQGPEVAKLALQGRSAKPVLVDVAFVPKGPGAIQGPSIACRVLVVSGLALAPYGARCRPTNPKVDAQRVSGEPT